MALGIDVPEEQRDAATYAVAALHALGREERRGRRPVRLLEAGHATWNQFRGRLGARHLLELLLEDGAVTQPRAFTVPEGLDLSVLSHGLVAGWLSEVPSLALEAPGEDYIGEQAARLGVSTRLAKSSLHRLKPHHRVLELPGSGGQLAYHLVTTHDDVYLQDVFTIACGDWREATLAGLVAVEVGLSGDAPVWLDPELRRARKDGRVWDYVVGLDPAKGGRFESLLLQQWFPKATVLLV
ncbi:MAG: hypothetical protein KC731_23040 [Myxococcales bacterium]|nr:hypothetical protein [Myxococcales bacterium]